MTTPVPPSPQRSRDFAELARRISGRTTDLFAIAIVVGLLMTVGVQVTRWWRAEPPEVAGDSITSAPLALWDQADGVAVTFDSGEWILERTTVVGTNAIVTDSILSDLGQQLASGGSDLPPVDSAEAAWLNKLQDWSPAVETGNGGRLYTLGGPWPWVVATVTPSLRINPDAANDARVLCWAFALPQSEQSWTLYIARRNGHPATSAAQVQVPLPAEVQPLLTATTSAGGLKAFRSAASISVSQSRWDAELNSSGWERQGEWVRNDNLARCIFRHGALNGVTTLDTTLTATDDGETRGIAEWRTEQTDIQSPDTRHQTTPP